MTKHCYQQGIQLLKNQKFLAHSFIEKNAILHMFYAVSAHLVKTNGFKMLVNTKLPVSQVNTFLFLSTTNNTTDL